MDDDTPAWMLCQDILMKAKEEFMTEALETLERAVRDGSVAVNGYVLSEPDKHQEQERSLFILNQIVARRDEMRARYAAEMERLGGEGEGDAAKVQTKERLRRFLLSLEKMTMLVAYSREIDVWIEDVGMLAGEAGASAIVAKSAMHSGAREEILDRMLKSADFASAKVFGRGELSILENARDEMLEEER